MKKVKLYVKNILPWLVAIGIFAYLFHKYPLNRVLEALGYVNLWAFMAFAIGYFTFIYIVDSWVMKKVFIKFSHIVSLKDIMLARGVTYLIMVLSYPASQVGFAYFLKRKYKIPIFDALGVFIFIVIIDLLWIMTLAFCGSFFQDYAIQGINLGYIIKTVTLCTYLCLLFWLCFWAKWPFQFKFLDKIRKKPIFKIFSQAKPADYLKTAIMRIPIHFTIIISMYIVLTTFHVTIPFTKILGNIPLVFFIGTLPITPGGLGATNAATVELLHPYISGPVFQTGNITPQELILAATLLWMFANYLMKIIVGSILLKKVSKDLFKAPTEEVEEKLEKQATHLGGNI